MTKLNRRAVIQVLIVLLLVLLLAFWALGKSGNQRRIVHQGPPEAKVTTENAQVPLDETVLEAPEEMSQAPPEQQKPIPQAVSHSGWFNNGAYEVFGQVQNVGNITARRVRAHVIFKNIVWVKFGEVESLIDNPTLAPGQKSNFKVAYKGSGAKDIRTYVLLFTVAR